MSLNLTQFKWFQYDENAAELAFDQDRHNEDYVLELHPGNIYGVKKRAHGIFVVHKNSPDIQFSLNDAECTRIVTHSKGWSGKIKRVAVKAGVGGLDKPVDSLPDGWIRMQVDSSNLNTVIYDSKRQVLYVAFHNGASWAYENVTKREYEEMEAAESRGRFFIYRIKYVKTQYKLGNNFDQPPYDVKQTSPSVMPEKSPAAKEKAASLPPEKSVKKPKVAAFEIPAGMKVNGRAKISITHSGHPGKSTVKTWSGVGFEWLGSKNPELGRLLGDLATTGKAEYVDDKGTAYLTLDDQILIPDESAPAAKKPAAKSTKKPAAKSTKPALQIPRGAGDTWLASEESYVGKKPLAKKVIAILKGGKVNSESDMFSLLESLKDGGLALYDKRAFNTAAKSLLSTADEYAFSEKGALAYKPVRELLMTMIKKSALHFM